MKKFRMITALFIIFALLVTPGVFADDEADWDMDLGEVTDVSIFDETDAAASLAELDIPAPSAILIEKETGTVIYEKNADEQLHPASVTKVMTMLLVVEAIESGNLSLDDIVTASEHAVSMGGTQIYLKEGEQMTVRDLLKSVVVGSANDAAVALAEHLSGTESAFAAKMNQRATELGMVNTSFINCTGLPINGEENITTARDISLMSRELIRYDMIKDFTTIWMDTVRNGEFGLSNTNKLIYYYEGATGLKTGFTKMSMYCLSATAERGGVEYIAVVMNCDTSDNRFASAKALLSYAFSTYTLVDVRPDAVFLPVEVKLGEVSHVQPVLQGTEKLLLEKSKAATVTKVAEIEESLQAPVEQGQVIGSLSVYDGDTLLTEIPIVAGDSVAKLTWGQVFVRFLKLMFTGGL